MGTHIESDSNRWSLALKHGIVPVLKFAEPRLECIFEKDPASTRIVGVEHYRALQIDFLHVAAAVGQSVWSVYLLWYES